MLGIKNKYFLFFYPHVIYFERIKKIEFDLIYVNEPVHEISNNVVCATSKASDQPAHTRTVILFSHF